jgi:hypothetical protein
MEAAINMGREKGLIVEIVEKFQEIPEIDERSLNFDEISG